MKKQLLATFMFIACISGLNAQTNVYHPFPDSGISWREDLDGVGFNCCCSSGSWQSYCLTEDNHELFLSGDTTIGPHVYSKIYRMGYYAQYLLSMYPLNCEQGCTNYNPQFYGNMYVGGLRQDIPGRKVYFYPAESGAQDTLLYDFNLNVGDFLPQSYNCDAGSNQVSSIDSVLIGTEYHKRFWLDNTNGNTNYAAIIEGIGSTFGLLFMIREPFEFFNELVCVKVDGQPVYPNTTTVCSLNALKDEQRIFVFSFSPNPVTDIAVLELSAEFQDAEVVIFNAAGKEVKRKKASGNSMEIHREDFDAGAYFFKTLNDKGQIGTGKFLVVQ